MGKTGKRPTKPKGNGRPASPKKPTPGCYVLSLSVENIRCFGPKQTLDCSDGEGRPRQWTVILGDNGTGKTTLLKMLSLCNVAWSETSGSPYYARSAAPVPRLVVHLGVGNIGTLPADNHEVILAAKTPGQPDGGERWESEDDSTTRPAQLLVAYDPSRQQFAMQSSGSNSVRHPSDFISADNRIRNVSEWLIRLDYVAAKDATGSKEARRDATLQLLIDVLDDVRDIRFITGSGPYPQPRVEFLTSYGWVPLNQLGHGYQTMIAWVTDFVSRMVERYPDSENPLAEPAVCLVDEIDLHLHPVWQRKVIGYLSERFPNTQFIVTAHSPLVVQAAASANANIAVLVRSTAKDADGNHYVEIRNNPEDVRNWRLDQILTSDLFGGLSLNPPNVEELFKEKEHLLGLKRLTSEQKGRLAEIDSQVAKLPVGDDAREVKEMQAIREAISHLQKRSAK